MQALPTHGVLIQLEGLGVYLIGDSGIGKSETALQLIHQGAVLICDDAPDFTSANNGNELMGNCPEQFYGLMHLRDLGVINIIELLGQEFFNHSQRIDFIIELIKPGNSHTINSQPSPDNKLWHFNLKQGTAEQFWTIPGIHIHLYPNRNAALLIQTAVKQFILAKISE